jgi:5-methylcytosine-specific restriction endonuclease McrA
MTKRRNNKRRPFNLRSRITSALRRIWLYSPQRRAAVAAAKADGNRCTKCRRPQAKLDIDHIESVVGVEGFNGDWTNYIKRLMEGELTWLCKPCHKRKTDETRKKRAEHKRKAAKRKRTKR